MTELADRLADLSPRQRDLLLRKLEERRGEESEPSREPSMDGSDDTGRYPLSLEQERLWVLDRMHPGRSTYNFPFAHWLEGDLEHSALEQSLGALLVRQRALRTIFALAEDGRPVQRVESLGRWRLPVVDLTGLRATERSRRALDLAHEMASRPMDLTRGPLYRARLLPVDRRRRLIVHSVHHIVFDGWSLGVFLRELTTLYDAQIRGRPAGLEPLPLSFGNFAKWQRNYLEGERLESLLEYWAGCLSGAPELLELPTDHPRPEVQSHRGATRVHRISSVPGALEDLALELGATPFMTWLAVFLALLHRWSGATDLVVGTDTANRDRVETEPLIGFFINVLVLRVSVADRPSLRELLERVRETALNAFAHQQVPFEKVAARLGRQRSASHNPLVQVLFLEQGAWPDVEPLAGGLEMRSAELTTPSAKFDLVVSVAREDDGLTTVWNYSTDLFEADTIERLQERFESLLCSLPRHPDQPIDLRTLERDSSRRQDTMAMKRPSKRPEKRRRSNRRAVSLDQTSLVESEPLESGSRLPLVVQPGQEDVDLLEWSQSQRDWIDEKLLEHGGLLFRGFDVQSVEEFEAFADGVSDGLFGDYGDLPEGEDGKEVYEATPYPPDKTILFHNEASHTEKWPMKQWFFCVQPAEEGGETPIVDCRALYRKLPDDLRERFETQGLRYVRNFIPGIDVDWKDFYGTDDRQEVERRCAEAGIECTWRDDGGLRVSNPAPAVVTHPKTGEKVLFNQIQLHHVSCLDEDARESLESNFGEDDLPRNVYWGDGAPIADEVVRQLLDLYWETCVAFPWQQGDVVMVDNMLTAHARKPYSGPRRTVVAMAEPFTSEQLRTATESHD